jgi:hypothetical protein
MDRLTYAHQLSFILAAKRQAFSHKHGFIEMRMGA